MSEHQDIEESHGIITTSCGCTVTARRAPYARQTETELRLCVWHSRWMLKAARVVASGAIQDATVELRVK